MLVQPNKLSLASKHMSRKQSMRNSTTWKQQNQQRAAEKHFLKKQFLKWHTRIKSSTNLNFIADDHNKRNMLFQGLRKFKILLPIARQQKNINDFAELIYSVASTGQLQTFFIKIRYMVQYTRKFKVSTRKFRFKIFLRRIKSFSVKRENSISKNNLAYCYHRLRFLQRGFNRLKKSIKVNNNKQKNNKSFHSNKIQKYRLRYIVLCNALTKFLESIHNFRYQYIQYNNSINMNYIFMIKKYFKRLYNKIYQNHKSKLMNIRKAIIYRTYQILRYIPNTYKYDIYGFISRNQKIQNNNSSVKKIQHNFIHKINNVSIEILLYFQIWKYYINIRMKDTIQKTQNSYKLLKYKFYIMKWRKYIRMKKRFHLIKRMKKINRFHHNLLYNKMKKCFQCWKLKSHITYTLIKSHDSNKDKDGIILSHHNSDYYQDDYSNNNNIPNNHHHHYYHNNKDARYDMLLNNSNQSFLMNRTKEVIRCVWKNKNSYFILRNSFHHWKLVYHWKLTRYKCLIKKGLRKFAQNCVRRVINKEFVIIGENYDCYTKCLRAMKALSLC